MRRAALMLAGAAMALTSAAPVQPATVTVSPLATAPGLPVVTTTEVGVPTNSARGGTPGSIVHLSIQVSQAPTLYSA